MSLTYQGISKRLEYIDVWTMETISANFESLQLIQADKTIVEDNNKNDKSAMNMFNPIWPPHHMTFHIWLRTELLQQPKQYMTEVLQVLYLKNFQCKNFLKRSCQKCEDNLPEVGLNMVAMEDISQHVFL